VDDSSVWRIALADEAATLGRLLADSQALAAQMRRG